MPRAYRPRKPAALAPIDLAELDGIDAQTEQGRLALLNRMAKSGNETKALGAIKLLEEMQKAKGTSLGPPPPTNATDTIERLAAILRCVPRATASKAFALVFDKPETAQRVFDEPAPEPETPSLLADPV